MVPSAESLQGQLQMHRPPLPLPLSESDWAARSGSLSARASASTDRASLGLLLCWASSLPGWAHRSIAAAALALALALSPSPPPSPTPDNSPSARPRSLLSSTSPRSIAVSVPVPRPARRPQATAGQSQTNSLLPPATANSPRRPSQLLSPAPPPHMPTNVRASFQPSVDVPTDPSCMRTCLSQHQSDQHSTRAP
ncbi:hypothetical protein PYCCODRAFT_166270 [Trametes coccinea BRFM310]|uniref:Uncharacterized protein n=1 Tax=Trametes coccinea (strain BRFM310) TaxID=1353009 RepID=A0A1Y2ITM4_TRAC3|nr:hypothetical protein PYCCODRAFT_166270 [Trametes coccinea BRFM310]